jgi:hypothetical protein
MLKVKGLAVAMLSVAAGMSLAGGVAQAQYIGNGVGAAQGQHEQGRERADEAQYGRTWLGGRVTAVNGVEVTVQRREDNAVHTFVVTQRTVFHKHRNEPAVYQDVHIGDHIRAEGNLQNGWFVAEHVAVFDEQQNRGEHSGQSGNSMQRHAQQ